MCLIRPVVFICAVLLITFYMRHLKFESRAMNLQKSKSISNHCYKKPQPKNHELRRKSPRAEAGELQKPEATESEQQAKKPKATQATRVLRFRSFAAQKRQNNVLIMPSVSKLNHFYLAYLH